MMEKGKEQLVAQTKLDQAVLGYPSHLGGRAGQSFLSQPTNPHGNLIRALFLQSLQSRDSIASSSIQAETKLTNGVCDVKPAYSQHERKEWRTLTLLLLDALQLSFRSNRKHPSAASADQLVGVACLILQWQLELCQQCGR
ncbi:TPA: hypothetical protein ACH3X2_012473 [Trebouxia sp. C0005]